MPSRSRTLAALAPLAAAALGAAALRACPAAGPALRAPAPAEAAAPGPAGAAKGAAASGPAGPAWRAPGWHDAAETVAVDLRRLLEGRPAPGAFEEARAEAARGDLALFPPDPAELRTMLLGSDGRARTLALAALAARAEATDDLVRIALRSQRPQDDEVVRLLGAELVSALPPDLLARHEEDLLRAFERESNPLVLAVAMPALERLEEPRLRALLESQLDLAGPEMLPVLAALARDRLGPGTLREVGVLVGSAE